MNFISELELKEAVLRFSGYGIEPEGGISRIFGSQAYREAAAAMKDYMESEGLSSYIDSVGNVHGILRGSGSQPCRELLIGSHLDTVQEGGRFDGLLGVVAGVLCCRQLQREGRYLPFDLHVIATNGEEGNDLGGTFGSRCMVGAFDFSAPGIEEKLRRYSLTPEAVRAAELDFSRAMGWLELHIEQGPTLEENGDELGVVTGIVGLQRYSILVEGKSNHAGTTMMAYRRDAVVRAAELIGDIHREYLEAGAQAIKTNSFALNRPALQGDEELARRAIRAGWELAAQAAAPFDAFVFADIGPVTALSPDQAAEEYRWVADRFLELGARHFLFETNATAAGLREAAEYIRAQAPESYIIVTFAVQPDGFSREGCFAADLLGEMRACSAVDAVGFNCVCGARHMLELARGLEHSGVTLALMPNAGYPVVVNNRTFYDGDPAYFAAQIAEMAGEGAAILGGCCGTTPAHIAQCAKALSQGGGQAGPAAVEQKPRAGQPEPRESRFWTKLQRGERVLNPTIYLPFLFR